MGEPRSHNHCHLQTSYRRCSDVVVACCNGPWLDALAACLVGSCAVLPRPLSPGLFEAAACPRMLWPFYSIKVLPGGGVPPPAIS